MNLQSQPSEENEPTEDNKNDGQSQCSSLTTQNLCEVFSSCLWDQENFTCGGTEATEQLLSKT
eukprot:UN03831